MSEESDGRNSLQGSDYRVIHPRTSESQTLLHRRAPRMISWEQFLRETSPLDRSRLREELTAALVRFLSRRKTVFLERFGVLEPRVTKKHITRTADDFFLAREEVVLTVQFEKCDDSLQHERLRNAPFVDTQELAQAVYAALPLELQILWNEVKVAQYLRVLMKGLRDEIVVDGVSKQLGPIGTFYALHNRQGETLNDWYAGADIFLDSALCEVQRVGPAQTWREPILDSAWELFDAAFGAPVRTFQIELANELRDIGYDADRFLEETKEKDRRLRVAVFAYFPPQQSQSQEKRTVQLLFCSDGLRRYGLQQRSKNRAGSELVFQLNLKLPVSSDDDTLQDQIKHHIPAWPLRPLTLGWILLQSAKAKSLGIGFGLSGGDSLVKGFESDLCAVLTTPFKRITSLKQSTEGPFRFVNLIGITEDEARAAELHGSEHLLALLRHRAYDQITYPTRSSLLHRSGLLSVQHRNAVDETPTSPSEESSPVPGLLTRNTH